MTAAKAITLRLMRLYKAHANWWIQSIICCVLLTITARIALPHHEIPEYMLSALIILCTIFSISINPFQELHYDFNSGHLQQFMMLEISRTSTIGTYILFKLIVTNILTILTQPFMYIILGINQNAFLSISTANLLAMNYTLILTFIISCLNIGKPNNILLLILTLPLTIPGIVLSILGIENQEYHALLLSIILGMLPLSIVIGEKILMISLREI